jgi:hypothetical protein
LQRPAAKQGQDATLDRACSGVDVAIDQSGCKP